MNTCIPEYCYDVFNERAKIHQERFSSCTKIVDGRCTVYRSVCRKFGGSQMLGCAFSPAEKDVLAVGRNRQGQQKQKHADRSYSSKNNRRNKYKRSE